MIGNILRCLAFEPTNANYILSGSNDTLRVHSWEPIQLLDTVHTGWKNIVDMTVHKDQLVRLAHRDENNLFTHDVSVLVFSSEHRSYKTKFIWAQSICL